MKWEYQQIPSPMGKEVEIANRAGQDGWELAAMAGPIGFATSALAPQQAQPGWLLMFKRPKEINGANPGKLGIKLPNGG